MCTQVATFSIKPNKERETQVWARMPSLVNDEKLITLIIIGSLITVLLIVILIVLIRHGWSCAICKCATCPLRPIHLSDHTAPNDEFPISPVAPSALKSGQRQRRQKDCVARPCHRIWIQFIWMGAKYCHSSEYLEGWAHGFIKKL